MVAKTVDTLVDDIYSLLSNGMIIPDEAAEEFGKQCAELLKTRFKEVKDRRESPKPFTLRLSGIGKPLHQLYYDSKGIEKEELEPHTHNLFMFGDLIEAYLLTLCKLTGHTVTDEQATVKVGGVKGHIDCIIDGKVIDVKSASPFAFQKFKDGTYLDGGGFASSYKYQIASYHEALGQEGDNETGFLAMNKVNGQLCLMMVDADFLPCPVTRINKVRTMLKSSTAPVNPWNPVPDGKSGNMKLNTQASYCPYKWHMNPKLRCFLYSTGPRYLTHVEREPKDSIPEINKDGRIVNGDSKSTASA